MKSSRAMNELVIRAAQEFVKILEDVLRNNLVRVVLFGSAARGDYGPESDLDILVVVRGGR